MALAPLTARAEPPRPSPASARPRPPPPPFASRAAARDPDPWFGPDKAIHFCASATLAGGGYALGALATDDIAGRLSMGAAMALGAGLAKEVFDATGHGTPSWRDLAWDALGAAVGLGLSVWLDLEVRPIQF
jgi:putative lipoprotein